MFKYNKIDYITLGGTVKATVGTFTNVTGKRIDLALGGSKNITEILTDSTNTHDTGQYAINPDREFLITNIDTGTETFTSLPIKMLKQCEIIGNVTDNPELLKCLDK